MKAAHQKSIRVPVIYSRGIKKQHSRQKTKNYFPFSPSALDNQLEGNQSTSFGFLTTVSPPMSHTLPLVIVATTQELCSEI